MMVLLEFDFKMQTKMSQDQFLSHVNKGELFDIFDGVGNVSAQDVIRAVLYLHRRDIVDRDIQFQI